MDSKILKASVLLIAFSMAGVLADFNWTELEEVIAHLFDVVGAVLTELPAMIMQVVYVMLILLIVKFVMKLLNKFIGMIDVKIK